MLRVWSLCGAPVNSWVLPADLYRTYCEKLVLEAVYRPTTHAQVSRVEADSFYRSIYLFVLQVRLLLNRA